MCTLLTDPLGRALLSVLTTDYGKPGAPQRKMLLRELQLLRAKAEAENAPAQVKGAIRSSLWALRAEFPTAYSIVPALFTAAVVASDAVSPAACISS